MNVDTSVILWAVPFYLTVILIEFFTSFIQNKNIYNKKEFLSNICVGVVQQVSDASVNLILIPFYIFLNRSSIFDLEASIFLAGSFFVLKDFMYYWTHRLSHHNSFIWSIHLVHHQPKYYNFSTGLRMPLFHYIVDIVPFCISALIGVPIETFVIVSVIWASMQILTHTRYIKREIKYFSLVFVTPSFHRVHHGKNLPYKNKNFGGVFSFWDKMFKTYQTELSKTPVIYGVSEQEYSLDPVGANFIGLKNINLEFQRVHVSTINALIIVFGGVFFIFNAKQLSVLQAFVQAFLLLMIFQLITKNKHRV